MATTQYPGTTHHQRVLRAVVAHYADDPRIDAVLVFGSLSRGNWDVYSDLDLDIVLANGVSVDVMLELRRLCDALASVGEQAAGILPKRNDEADVVFASLLELSIRYHPLATTSPNITDSLRMLWGRIDEDAIRAAGNARRQKAAPALDILCGQCLRALVEVDVALQRGRLWFAVESLALARDRLIELYGFAREAIRPLHYFEEHADAALRERLGATLPGASLAAAQQALIHCLELVAQDLGALSAGKVALTPPQRALLQRIRERASALPLAPPER